MEGKDLTPHNGDQGGLFIDLEATLTLSDATLTFLASYGHFWTAGGAI